MLAQSVETRNESEIAIRRLEKFLKGLEKDIIYGIFHDMEKDNIYPEIERLL